MQRSDFRFFERLRVRWAEIDAQQIVFNGHYLMYFDTAIAGYWRTLAMPYHETMAALSGDMFVRKATLEYLGSARYDDVLEIGMRCARIGNSSMAFQAGAFRQEQLLVSGELVYVFADPKAKEARPVPLELRTLFESFEAGEPMVQVRVGAWNELGSAARPIRAEVFIDEQKIPAEMEWDDADADAVHAVAFNRLGRALGTGRMLEHVPGVAKIGRMAVAATSRHSGVGRAVLDSLLDAARARGDRQAMLHAQISAASFYERAGFVRRGPEFDEAGIAHVEMVRAL
ncbi:MAG TPA: YbgC/FadM family acyl-CoA thioesterase [Caldimonas sp.]|nr:YbgC/FadM family acyl-CoA thioesterase [Caldimonas sp.]HEX4235008.1 YbgC/FadM family acyl-CoA thioesterase [Caldimonas sp.]